MFGRVNLCGGVPRLWRDPRLFSWEARDLEAAPFLGSTAPLDRSRALALENGTVRAGLAYLLALYDGMTTIEEVVRGTLVED